MFDCEKIVFTKTKDKDRDVIRFEGMTFFQAAIERNVSSIDNNIESIAQRIIVKQIWESLYNDIDKQVVELKRAMIPLFKESNKFKDVDNALNEIKKLTDKLRCPI